jgi:ribose transport system permease protein
VSIRSSLGSIPEQGARDRRGNTPQAVKDAASRFAIFFGILLASAIFSLLSPAFLTLTNLFNVARIMSIDGMLAVGMTFVILGRGIDLSVGSTLALSGATAVLLIPAVGLPLAVGVAIVTGAIIGIINGAVITLLSIQPFVATLATMVIVRGLTFFATGGYPILVSSKSFEFIGNGYVGPVPLPIFVFIALVLLGYIALNHTTLGPRIYALGGDPEAARRFGVNTNRVTVISYMICGLLAAAGGIVLAGRLASASPVAGSGYELDAIAAVVIGGTSLSGGRGSIIGTVGGVAIIAIMNNGLDLLDVDPNYQLVIKGLIILLAVSIDAYFHKQRE